MNKIAMIGSGYVGLVTGTCLSDFGFQVTCVDKNESKIEKLKNGITPIYEPGLHDLIQRNTYYKRLNFTTDIKKAIEENDVIFIAVGTPPQSDGSADLHYVKAAAEEIGDYINGYKVIVNKSTVPIGTGKKVKDIINQIIRKRGENFKFDIVSNPEFLREGSAIQDFTHTDRVIIGAETEKAKEVMKEVYRILYLNETPFLITNIETAELTKYASNAFLATKISFINELSELCEKTGADIQHVSKGMGMDGRIGSKFLHVGPGYGGSCFPKDTRALVSISKEYDCDLSIINATIKANEKQKIRLTKKIIEELENEDNKTVAVLGLAFKNNTDDTRESPALSIIEGLACKGFNLRVYDPKAIEEAKIKLKKIEDRIVYCSDEYDAAANAEALIIVTEWNQFRSLNLDKVKQNMDGCYFFDLRNIYNKEIVEAKGYKYYSVGR